VSENADGATYGAVYTVKFEDLENDRVRTRQHQRLCRSGLSRCQRDVKKSL